MDARLQERLRATAPTPEGIRERGLLLLRSGYAEHAGECVLDLLQGRDCPLALLDALTPPELSAFETRVLGERFERGRLGDLAFGPRAEELFCVLDRDRLASCDLASETWSELTQVPARIRSLDCDRTPILTYGDGPQPVVRWQEGALEELPSPQAHGGRELVAGLLPGAYLVRGSRWLKAYAEAGAKKRAIWSLSVPGGDGVAGVGAGGAVLVEQGQDLSFYELGSRKPSHRVEAEPLCPGAAQGWGFRRELQVQRAGAGAHLLYGLAGREHAHALSWVSPDAQLCGRVELPFGAWRWASSPGGRFALLLAQEYQREGPNHLRTHQVFLADLERDRVRELTLPALPGGLAWSRTGRSFAISTEEGTVLLGRADGAPAVASGQPGEVTGRATWEELYKAQRFWRGRQVGALVEFHYGARGSAGVQRSKRWPSEAAAAKDLARRVRAKLREGYV